MSERATNRRSTHTIRFSDAEWRNVLDLADAAGLRPTVFVRESALGQRLRRRPKASDLAAHGAAIRALIDRDLQLARIGNNLNQLVRLAHGGRVRHDENFRETLDGIVAEVEESRAEIHDLAEAFRENARGPRA